MYNRRRNAEIVQKAQERRAREDSARRLRDEVPLLASLSLNIQQFRADGGMAESDHTRRVVVEHAPALFVVPCGEKGCEDGGHDLTLEVMRALRAGQTKFEGRHECAGHTGAVECRRTMRWVATATFRAPA